MNAGLHFGNANTMAATQKGSDAPSPLMLQGAAALPSIAAHYKGQWRFGQGVRYWVGLPDAVFFHPLPTLFAQAGAEDGQTNQAEEAVLRYLESVTRGLCQAQRCNQLQRLVISLPDSWWAPSAQSVPQRFRSVCRCLDTFQDFQLLPTSQAVLVWFSHAFRRKNSVPFQGTVLLLDCGTQDLHLTLTELAGTAEAPEGIAFHQIAQLHAQEGAGDAYLHGLLSALLHHYQLDTPLRWDAAYWSTLEQLRNELIFGAHRLRETVDEYGLEDFAQLEQEFIPLTYRGQTLSVSYQLLAQVYQQTVFPVLQELLNQMTARLDRYEIPYWDPKQERFQILLTGGFSNFYLVRRQIQDAFGLSSFDGRRKGKPWEHSDASAKGAALVASGAAVLSHLAPFSLGLYMRDADGAVCVDYAFQLHQPITFGTPYFPVSPTDHQPIKYLLASGAITALVVNRSESPKTALVVPLRTELQARLAHLTENEYGTVELGFSLEASGTICLHVRDYDLLNDSTSPHCRTIPLARYEDLFEPTMVRRVIDL